MAKAANFLYIFKNNNTPNKTKFLFVWEIEALI